jgi:nucleoside-diphosphate-sugar epimerase
MVQAALKHHRPITVGSGTGIWSRIHIQDLCSFYLLLTQSILSSHPPANGKTGYYFAENGEQSWKSIAEKIGEVGRKIGAWEGSEVGRIGLEEAKEEFGYGSERDAEGVMGSRYGLPLTLYSRIVNEVDVI